MQRRVRLTSSNQSTVLTLTKTRSDDDQNDCICMSRLLSWLMHSVFLYAHKIYIAILVRFYIKFAHVQENGSSAEELQVFHHDTYLLRERW